VVKRPCSHGHLATIEFSAEAKKVFDIELAALKQVRANSMVAFDRAVETIVDTLRRRGKIVVLALEHRQYRSKIAHTHQHRVHERRRNSVDALHATGRH